MSNLFKNWCTVSATDVTLSCKIHSLQEIAGSRAAKLAEIQQTVYGHYEDPQLQIARIQRLGLPKAAKVLASKFPASSKARSGHVGEILATEVVPLILSNFHIPIKRLRWLDGREMALRGEDVVGILQDSGRVRFLKGESKSRLQLTPAVVRSARKALLANRGRPSQYALSYMMTRCHESGQNSLALLFESYLAEKTIPARDMVHMIFALTGNNAFNVLHNDILSYTGKIDQCSVHLTIADHAAFVASIFP